jgi:hypothetical protein
MPCCLFSDRMPPPLLLLLLLHVAVQVGNTIHVT